MKAKVITEESLKHFVNSLIGNYRVFGPKKKRNIRPEYEFGEIYDYGDISLDYKTTILPPKKFLIPQNEVLLTIKSDYEISSAELQFDRRHIIFGIHSCDVNGFLLLDKVFLDKYPLPNYRKRRENLSIIALTCTEPDETCFCTSMGTGPTLESGFDLLLTPLKKDYLVESGSREGEYLLKKVEGREAGKKDYELKENIVADTKKKFKRYIDMDGIPEIFKMNLEHDLWKRLGEIDLACAQCIHSCPTCYCFDIRDKLKLDLSRCERCMEWDACFLLEFSEVALGGNFRRDRSARVRQFMGHNLSWGGASQYDVFDGRYKCVGCGRCIRTCPVNIDITEVAAELRGEKVEISL